MIERKYLMKNVRTCIIVSMVLCVCLSCSKKISPEERLVTETFKIDASRSEIQAKTQEWISELFTTGENAFRIYHGSPLTEKKPALESVRITPDGVTADGVVPWRVGVDLFYKMKVDFYNDEYTVTLSDLFLARAGASDKRSEIDTENNLTYVKAITDEISLSLYQYIQGLPEETDLEKQFNERMRATRQGIMD